MDTSSQAFWTSKVTTDTQDGSLPVKNSPINIDSPSTTAWQRLDSYISCFDMTALNKYIHNLFADRASDAFDQLGLLAAAEFLARNIMPVSYCLPGALAEGYREPVLSEEMLADIMMLVEEYGELLMRQEHLPERLDKNREDEEDDECMSEEDSQDNSGDTDDDEDFDAMEGAYMCFGSANTDETSIEGVH